MTDEFDIEGGERVTLYREGTYVGYGTRFVLLGWQNRAFEACTFWTKASLRPGEVFEFEPSSIAIRGRAVAVMCPKGGQTPSRASAIILSGFGAKNDQPWQTTLNLVRNDEELQRRIAAEAADSSDEER